MTGQVRTLLLFFLIIERYFLCPKAQQVYKYGRNVGTCHCADFSIIEPRREKTNVLVSHQVRHKPGCTATEDG